MKVTERNQAGREVVVKRTRKPFAYLQELVDACLTTLTARLWATCRWPGTLGDGWKIGDSTS